MEQRNFLLVLILSLLTGVPSLSLACTGDYYSLPAGTRQDINECGTCRSVTNNSAMKILVPTKTNAEWTAFYTNVTAGTGGTVVIGACALACTYALDTITPPVAAYSLHKLKTSYVGPLIRVRRSSDNTEMDIPFAAGCGSLDTAALTAFVGAGNGFVKTWYDQSGNGRNAVQTTNGSQPRIVNAGTVETKFGQPTIFFNGSTFIPGVALGMGSTSSWSYSAVVGSTTFVNGAAGDGAGTYYLDRTAVTNNIMSLKAVGGKLCMQKRNDASGGLGCISTTTNISTTAIQSLYTNRIYNTSYSVYLNNTGESTVAETDGALTPPTPNIGRHQSGTTAANFGMFELILWDTSLTSGDRTTVYMRQKDDFGF